MKRPRCETPEKLRYRDEIEARAAAARLNRRYPDDPVEPYLCDQPSHGWHLRRIEKARQRAERAASRAAKAARAEARKAAAEAGAA